MASKKRTRGPNKQTPWARGDSPASVLRLALDTGDPLQRSRLEGMFATAFALRRALQHDVRNRIRAYCSARHEREEKGPGSVRERLGLSRPALERAAYGHLNDAPHLRTSVTKALAMHLADSVFTAAERHLFRDAKGKTQGLLHIGRWFDFARLPGRARSRTTPRKWETFRLHGTLSGHRTAYTGSDGRFFQPRTMRSITMSGTSWWSHAGPLVVVFSGLAGGDLVLPVRLPSAPSNQAILDDRLQDPEAWHKIDLVRRRDPNAAGGWRYEAHLMLLKEPYASPRTTARRVKAAGESAHRTAGIDVNVSNISVASRVGSDDLLITRIERDAGEREGERQRRRKERRRGRALDRSRRAANPDQYRLSLRQEERARRREAAGLPPQLVIPQGPRKSRTDGKPLQAYRKDALSRRYKRERAAQAASAAASAQARKALARRVAGAVVLQHGFRAVVEDCNLTAWARRWGRAMSAFSPGTLLDAIRTETLAVANVARVAGGIRRASTRSTALSQHCLCGSRAKKTLGERVHNCPTCGLRGDRDAVSAVLASFVRFTDDAEPTAFVDFDAARGLLGARTSEILLETLDPSWGRQDAPPESTAPSALDGSSVEETGRTSRDVMARQHAGTAPRTTPNETGSSIRTKSERARTRTGLSKSGVEGSTPLRDSS